MNNNFLLTLGLCRKASALLKGRTETMEALQKGIVKEIFISADISEKSKKEIQRQIDIFGGKIIPLSYTMEELGNALGLKPIAVFAITNEGLLKSLKSKTAVNEEAEIHE